MPLAGQVWRVRLMEDSIVFDGTLSVKKQKGNYGQENIDQGFE